VLVAVVVTAAEAEDDEFFIFLIQDFKMEGLYMKIAKCEELKEGKCFEHAIIVALKYLLECD
jgi:hypothetical protein